jgi:hypothetical protein
LRSFWLRLPPEGGPVRTKIIEARQDTSGTMVRWGTFLIGKMDTEWIRASRVGGSPVTRPLLSLCGWPLNAVWVLDLQTGEGALFLPGGPPAQLNGKRRIRAGPLYEPFLKWLDTQDVTNIAGLPELVELPASH